MYATESLQVLRPQPMTNVNNAISALKNTTSYIAIHSKCTLARITAVVDVVLDTAASICTVSKRVLLGSDVGAVTLGTITIPTLTAAGKVVYKDRDAFQTETTTLVPTDFELLPGDEIKIVRADTGGSGSLQYGVHVYIQSESAANCTDMIKSA